MSGGEHAAHPGDRPAIAVDPIDHETESAKPAGYRPTDPSRSEDQGASAREHRASRHRTERAPIHEGLGLMQTLRSGEHEGDRVLGDGLGVRARVPGDLNPLWDFCKGKVVHPRIDALEESEPREAPPPPIRELAVEVPYEKRLAALVCLAQPRRCGELPLIARQSSGNLALHLRSTA